MIHYNEYTIHIVDDSKLVIASLKNVLEAQGYNVVYSMNGKEALEAIYNNNPSLIILDVEMPVMNGYETIKLLKDSPDTSWIPVIFHTSLTKPEVVRNLFELGASDYISKPFVAEELLARVLKEIKNINLQNLLKEKMSKLAKAVSQDTLTKTFNRTYMTSVINKRMHLLEKENKDIFSFIYIDIDDFNKFNTMNGFKKSDHALHKFSKIVQMSLRDSDILSRWEADKFLVLLPKLSKIRLRQIANAIISNVAKTSFSSTIGLSCSIAMIEIITADNMANIIKKLENKMIESKKIRNGTILMIE
ncbi:MAG: response regulator [Campylobacterales bacterium]|nr:response regulator [Campylobacterales bacterium]